MSLQRFIFRISQRAICSLLLGLLLTITFSFQAPDALAAAKPKKPLVIRDSGAPPKLSPWYAKRDCWQATMSGLRERFAREGELAGGNVAVWGQLERDFPIECDWFLQDLAGCDIACSFDDEDLDEYPIRWFTARADAQIERRLIRRAGEELGAAAGEVLQVLARLEQAATPPHDRAWLDLYVAVCRERRTQRLKPLAAKCPQIVFTKHYNMGGSHYAYTEGLSDAQAERHFKPGAALCLLELDGGQARVRTLLDDPHGVIRDPDVSYDGRRVLFAWKKSLLDDDYHLYEMNLDDGAVRQLTSGLGYADYEGAYLPDGDIIFNSTRCVQTVDCFTTEVSNFYACDRNGRQLRRLCFDQVHTNFPTVTSDGRVLYTRWEYNDRGQIYPQALFQMNADGSNQGAFYGNNSFFPTTILHARNIFGTQKVLAIASGHHSRQTGKLIVLDPSRGREEAAGAQLVAPLRPTPADRIDAYGQDGELFQYPYPLSETDCLATYNAWGWRRQPLLFGVYYMTLDGRRELLAADPQVSCNQPIPVRRPAPRVRPSQVDYAKSDGTYYVQDVYAGPGLAGVARGTAKKLRVVALDYRPALIGGNYNLGVAGAAFVATPVAVGNGCWDPKIVLGETPVHDDGSVFFRAPARTPVYFQLLDQRDYVIQTMRSWSTLQPGENASCIGCHENKNSAPGAYPRSTSALREGPQTLTSMFGRPRGFSFPQRIQPILDRHCTRCHFERDKVPALASRRPASTQPPATNTGGVEPSFSLLAEETVEPIAKRRWSDAYLALTAAVPAKRGDLEGVSRPLLNWVSPQSAPPMLPPYSAGAATSELLPLLERGHKGVHLSREELATIACWIDLVIPYCGDYIEANAWTAEERSRYDRMLSKRRSMEALEAQGVRDYLIER